MNIILPSFLTFVCIDRVFSNILVNLLFYIIVSSGGLIGYIYFPTIQIHSPIFEITLSYFVYDILACFYYKFDTIFLFHGIMAFIIYFLCYYFEYYTSEGLFFLTYEYSTIFLNLMKVIPQTSNYNTLVKINNSLFATTFFIFRIYFGTFMSISFINNVTNELLYYNSTNETNKRMQLIVNSSIICNNKCDTEVLFIIVNSSKIVGVVLNFIFVLLNYFWFYKIIRKLYMKKNKQQ
jgi:hypothetical protein